MLFSNYQVHIIINLLCTRAVIKKAWHLTCMAENLNLLVIEKLIAEYVYIYMSGFTRNYGSRKL